MKESLVDILKKASHALEQAIIHLNTGNFDAEPGSIPTNPSQNQQVLEVVIDKDERERIVNTSLFPWRCICCLRITTLDNRRFIGTGWLISPHVVLTAGHCVYHHDRGGWAKEIEVIPGCNGEFRPYGSCITSTFRSVSGWIEQGNEMSDYGAIILPADYPYGQLLGTFEIGDVPDYILENLMVTIGGYPSEKPLYTQWAGTYPITRVLPRNIEYSIDTTGGQSGAPVWMARGDRNIAVGIHTTGSRSGNSATRITRNVIKIINSWIMETE